MKGVPCRFDSGPGGGAEVKETCASGRCEIRDSKSHAGRESRLRKIPTLPKVILALFWSASSAPSAIMKIIMHQSRDYLD